MTNSINKRLGMTTSSVSTAKPTYTASSRTHRFLSKWAMNNKSPNKDIKEFSTIRARSHHMVANLPLVKGAFDINIQNVIGNGLVPHSAVDFSALGISEEEGERISKILDKEFSFWANSVNADAERTQNFYEMQAVAFGSMLLGGDVFALLPTIDRPNTPYKTAVALIEADQVCNRDGMQDSNSVAGGVEVDEYNAPKKYHMLKAHPGEFDYSKEWISVDAFDEDGNPNVLHVFDKTRPGQKRGVPYFAPIIKPLKLLDDYTEAELTAALVGALLTVFVTSEEGDGFGDYDLSDNESTTQNEPDYSLSPGSVIGLKPGEKVEIADPNRPNKNYDIFYQAIVREIGVGLNIPYEILVKHFNKSYTASRAAFLELWKYIKRRRVSFQRQYTIPLREKVLTEAVLLGRIELPGFLEDPFVKASYLKCNWTGEVQGQINEAVEVRAADMRVKAGFSTRTEETAKLNGGDFDHNISLSKTESAKMMDAGLMQRPEECVDNAKK